MKTCRVLEHEQQQLAGSWQSPEIDLHEVEAWFRRRRKKTDSAVSKWMRAGEWPAAEPELRWHLLMRLAWGYRLALLLSMNNWPPPPSYREAMRWLLVDTWKLCGEAQAEADLKSDVFVSPRRGAKRARR